jgi:hypothetical protein
VFVAICREDFLVLVSYKLSLCGLLRAQTYTYPVTDISILHAQVESSSDGSEPAVELPPFLDVEKRISDTSKEDDDKYSAYKISIIKR